MSAKIHGRRTRGFTLIEVLMTVAILGILVSLAMPSFVTFINKGRLTGLTNELLGDISYARSEAAARQVDVAICVSADQVACATSQTWDKGRMIFVDSNADGLLTGGETVLRVSQAMESTTVTTTGFGGAGVIRFRPFGGVRPATGGSLKLCPSSGTEGRTISVAATGRPVVSKSTCP